MAVSKLHLKNNNKDYKLKKTDKRTKEGKIIYENTLTGELHSELSMTLEMPEGSGNWINIPSLINGRVYNRQGVIDMLNAGKIEPTSTGHLTQDAAVEAAIYRSNNLQDDAGVSLRPNNELTLSKDSIMHPDNANKTQGYSQADLDQINQDYRAEQSVAQTERLTKIMNNQDLEKQDDYYKWFEGSNRPERILDKATQYIDKSGPTHREKMQAQVDSTKQQNRWNEISNRMNEEKNDQFYKMKGNVNNDQFYNIGEGNPFGSSIFGNYRNLPKQYLQPYGQERMEANMATRDRAMSSYEPRPTEALNAAELARQQAAIGQAMSAYGPRTGQSPIPEGAVLTYEDGRAYNGAVQMINGQPADAAGQKLVVNDAGTVPVDDTNQAMLTKAAEERELRESQKRNKGQTDRLAAIMDRANAEKQDEFYDPNKPRTNVWGDNNPRYWEGWGKGVGGPKALQNAFVQGPVSAADQAMFDAAKREREIGRAMSAYQPYPTKNRAMDEAMSSYGPRFTPEMDTGKGSSDGRRAPINIPKYVAPTDKIVPEVVNVPKNVKPDYGKMPGFKFHQAEGQKAGQGYWSADETSDFWQTDAGYDKAMQTWGQKPGWVKPGYRPKKKELDIEAIKKWFKPNK